MGERPLCPAGSSLPGHLLAPEGGFAGAPLARAKRLPLPSLGLAPGLPYPPQAPQGLMPYGQPRPPILGYGGTWGNSPPGQRKAGWVSEGLWPTDPSPSGRPPERLGSAPRAPRRGP